VSTLILIAILIFAGGGAVIYIKWRQLNPATLDAVAALVGGTVDRDAHAVTGHVGKDKAFPVTFTNKLYRTAAWTEVSVTVPATALDVEVRPRTPAESQAAADGRAVDVPLGDPELEKAFIVEGAPAAVVRGLLTPERRRALVALAPVTLRVAGTKVLLITDHLVRDDDEGRRLVELAGDVATGLAQAGPVELPAGTPSRAAAQEARDRERAALLDAKSQRHRTNLVAGIAVIVVLAAIFGFLVVRGLRARAERGSGPTPTERR
jgi:hypothetical protein